jgi:hypothetical protein
MSRSRVFITPGFLNRIRRDGQLARASERVRHVGGYERLAEMSTWALVCEEVVDTEYDSSYYERVVAELSRRGIVAAELEEMRLFAWETAGWMNFEKMVWDWAGLDERDIFYAIDWQLRDAEISSERATEMKNYAQKYVSGPQNA